MSVNYRLASNLRTAGHFLERAVRLAEALGRLSADYREVLVLRNFEELPFQEVAERMGREVKAVRMLWIRALAALAKQLPDDALGDNNFPATSTR